MHGELLTELKVHAERLTGARQPPLVGESIAAFCGSGTMNFAARSLCWVRASSFPGFIHGSQRNAARLDRLGLRTGEPVGRPFRNRMFAYGVRLAPSLPQSALASSASFLQSPAQSDSHLFLDRRDGAGGLV